VSPLPHDLHASSPWELQERLEAERRGAPFLIYRDSSRSQVLVDLGVRGPRLTVGRRAGNALALEWDDSVSRTHAAFELVAADWTVVDEGLSRNGTFVNGERLHGRRRLRDGDVVTAGETAIAFRVPATDSESRATRTLSAQQIGELLTPAQRRVLVALCRPFADTRYAAPATNREIAAELIVTVDAVKRMMRRLFDIFEIEDLPQNEKRTALAVAALRSGALERER
jgi:pSer/pThr/pTyr-binding forkhead associated (FHA) protein